MHHGTPQGLILHLLFMHICCFSGQLFTTELQGIATLIILQHSFFPDVSHSSHSCCVRGRTLIAHKFLIKKNTEQNQSDILPVLLFMYYLQCLFINSLICSTVTLLVFLFLLLSKEKSLTISQVLRHGSSQQQPQAQLDPQRDLNLVPSRGVVGAAPELSARRGWPGDRQGTPWGCPPWHASTSWGCRQPWAARGPRSHAGAGCFLGSFEPFLSYLVCIFWIP